jgi:cell division protein FtsW
MGVVLFTGGVRLGHGLLLAGLALPLIWKLVERVQYALQRVTSYLDQGGAPAEASYQLKQSLIAIGSGGWFGVGFGQGKQQAGFLPFPYNDFIGSNIGEEWGFMGLLGVTLLFVLYGWLGFRIAKAARTPFQQLLATGLTFSTVSTAFLHLGVVIGLLPTTGLTLPFVSYGRTNLILTIVMTGIIVNIGSTRERVALHPASDPMSMSRA